MTGSGGGLAVVVLAAGQGSRMRSVRPKVLHEALGRPLLDHVLTAVEQLEPDRVLVVIGHGGDEVRARFTDRDVTFVEQTEQLGTAHALLCTRPELEGRHRAVLVVYGDQPLVDPDTLRALVDEQRRHGGAVMLSYEIDDPFGLGRVVRGPDGAVERVVEEKDATELERAIHEVYPGVFLFDDAVYALAAELTDDNAAGEYYLTDMVELYLRNGRGLRAVRGHDRMRELIGVNSRAELARAEDLLQQRVRARWLESGVTMQAPSTTVIEQDVVLARDVVLEPGVILRGRTRVGPGARIGAYAVLDSCEVSAGASVASHTVAVGTTFTAP